MKKSLKKNSVFIKKVNSFIENFISFLSTVIGGFIKIISTVFSKLHKEIKIIILVFIAGLSVFLIFNKVTTTTKVTATHIGYEKIDELYTSFTVVPIIKKSYSSGIEKGIENTITFWRDSDISTYGRVNGFVVAYYNMTIGYDKVSDKIGPFIGGKCPASLSALPEPTILSLKASVSTPEGDAGNLAEQLYVTPSNRSTIENVLLERLKKRKQWDELVARGKSVLNTYISFYCVEDE